MRHKQTKQSALSDHLSKTENNTLYLYGKHPVTLALTNPHRRILEIYHVKGALDELSISSEIPTHLVPRERLDALVGRNAVHQGIVAKCTPLCPLTLEDLINKTVSQQKALIVALDQVTDPHNIGAILRSATAFFATAVIVPETGTPDETGVLAKSASGALELIPYIRVKNLARSLDILKKNGFWCIGLDGYASHSIYETKLPDKCVIIMGSEGDGLRRLTAEKCDDTVKLPMDTRVESLNVSNACAITLYEWNRQQKGSE